MIFTAVNRVNFLRNNKWPTRATVGLCVTLTVCHWHRCCQPCWWTGIRRFRIMLRASAPASIVKNELIFVFFDHLSVKLM